MGARSYNAPVAGRHALQRFEELAERLVEGTSLRLLGARLQPVSLARALARAADSAQAVSDQGLIIPSRFRLLLHTRDLSALAPYQQSLERNLGTYLDELARERSWRLLAPPRVVLSLGDRVAPGRVRAEPIVCGEPAADNALALSGATVPLRLGGLAPTPPPRSSLALLTASGERILTIERLPLRIGRALENDLVLEDARASRRHALIDQHQGRLYVQDLESTNGTFVNGQRVERCLLAHGDELRLGDAVLRVRIEEPA